MKITALINLLTYLEPFACVLTLIVMSHRRQLASYKFLSLYVATRVTSLVINLPLLRMAGHQIPLIFAYNMYFCVYWLSYATEAALALCLIYSVYRLAMAPLKGLQFLGTLMFRWAAAISLVIALGMAFNPRVTSRTFIISAVGQFQQTQSILTLCLLIFVTLAIRPMGLSYSSKIFGVSVGLSVVAMSDLIGSSWIAHSRTMYSSISLLNGLSILLALAIWTTYFALPEPKRRMIILPTTSPFLRWNQISLALGDAPGFVAVGGVPPEILAPAEIEIMKRASLKMMMEPIKM